MQYIYASFAVGIGFTGVMFLCLVRATEEEKEGKQKVNVGPEENVEEKGGKKGGPKKLFKWNEEIRSDIFEIAILF